ncbi:MAG TPA: translation initiation factor IF-3 [Kofleriaceae bacterium]|nr:translation initiation factor IF-3 [Kofleriaceae bacterium]
MNGRIRMSPVRVVMEDGTQLGVIPTEEALAKARELGLDLLEVSPNARPPVCKIIDAGKWKYEQSKKQREAKRNATTVELKQIKLRPKTDSHDIEFKTKHAKRFLEEGNKVQFVVRFRGRENAHPETGRAALDRIMAGLVEVAKLERMPVYENRVMTMTVAPK